jgi:hypothetical protein
MGGFKMEYYVEIVLLETNETVKRMGPMAKYKAEKFERVANISLNHEYYYTRIVSDIEA